MSIIKNYFRSVSKEFNAKYEKTKEIKHSLSKGENREHFIREFLENLYPKKFVIGKGEILDSKGNISNQADIILYNEYNPVFDYGTTKLFLSEGVIAHIEVKSNLSKNLEDALNTCNSIKKLEKDIKVSIGFLTNSQLLQEQRGKIFTSIFAYEGSAKDTFKQNIHNYYKNDKEINNCVDLICILNKYVMYKDYKSKKLKFLETKEDSLLAFYYKLYEIINSTILNYTPIDKYFKQDELTFEEF